MNEEIKNLINQSKNICLIPSENEPESLTASLALFYTLRELGKNVNLISEKFPEKLNFLIPPVDFISAPKNFVISIPRSITDISQIYYEKTDESLKIHLTTDKGSLKKENISFYFQESKPDLILTFGIQDFKKYLESKLDSFAFLLGSEIINIDNNESNLRFGQVNVVEQKSLAQITLEIIKSFNESLVNKNIANCILAGLIIYYENFKKATPSEVFRIASDLVGKGANNQQIVDNLYITTEREINFLGNLFQNLQKDGSLSYAIINSDDTEMFSESESASLIEKIKSLGIQNNILALWESHSSDPVVKGFFYSKNNVLISKVANDFMVDSKNGWVFILDKKADPNYTKERVLKLIS